uniref:Uncharacterized protein n=1 Tax=Trichogramma kaykai TaxID=54128 RepID=A0ABD2WXJ4_9HYME
MAMALLVSLGGAIAITHETNKLNLILGDARTHTLRIEKRERELESRWSVKMKKPKREFIFFRMSCRRARITSAPAQGNIYSAEFKYFIAAFETLSDLKKNAKISTPTNPASSNVSYNESMPTRLLIVPSIELNLANKTTQLLPARNNV